MIKVATRAVIGPLFKPGGNVPWAKTTIRFTPIQLFASATIGYAAETYFVTTDDNGTFSILLAVPDSGSVVYRIQFPDGNSINHALGIGTPISIATIITLGTILGTPNQFAQLLLQHTFLALPDTPDSYTGQEGKLIRVKSNGTGIEFVTLGSGNDAHYRHVQSLASITWIITHGLGKRVVVSVIDSAGDEVHGNIRYDSDNQVTVTFSSGFSGEAYCN